MQAVGKGSEKASDQLQAQLRWRETDCPRTWSGLSREGQVVRGAPFWALGRTQGFREPGRLCADPQLLGPRACLHTRTLVPLCGRQGLGGQEFSIFSFLKDQNENYDGIHSKN